MITRSLHSDTKPINLAVLFNETIGRPIQIDKRLHIFVIIKNSHTSISYPFTEDSSLHNDRQSD